MTTSPRTLSSTDGFSWALPSCAARSLCQATGQGKNELFPESKDLFFLKTVDAQIAFTRGEDGAVSGLTLFQNGREIPAPKE